MNREDLEISGGRKLYLYTFEDRSSGVPAQYPARPGHDPTQLDRERAHTFKDRSSGVPAQYPARPGHDPARLDRERAHTFKDRSSGVPAQYPARPGHDPARLDGEQANTFEDGSSGVPAQYPARPGHDPVHSDGKQAMFWGLVGDEWRKQAEAVEAWFAPVTFAMNDIIGPGPGLGLDLGCGAGSMRLPESWQVLGVDIAREMRPNVVSSCHPLPFRSETFSLVVSRFALMFAADPGAAFSEARRVLKKRGRFVFAVWGAGEDNLWSQIPQEVISRHLGLRMPEPDEPHAFRLGNVEEVCGLLYGAGFEPGRPVTVEVPYLNELTPADAVNAMASLAGPMAAALQKMRPNEAKEAKAEIARRYADSDITGLAFIWSALHR